MIILFLIFISDFCAMLLSSRTKEFHSTLVIRFRRVPSIFPVAPSLKDYFNHYITMKSFLAEFKETLEITFFLLVDSIRDCFNQFNSSRDVLHGRVGRREFYYYFKHPFFFNLPKSSAKVMHGIWDENSFRGVYSFVPGLSHSGKCYMLLKPSSKTYLNQLE